ncbi:MAG: cellulose binding domain-containing protein [Polyangiaceae bacterium]|jgi:hypothetical protein
MITRQWLSMSLFVVAACAVAPGEDGAAPQDGIVSQASSALDEAVTATVAVGNKNSHGYPVTVRVTNTGVAPTTSWTVVLNLNTKTAISGTSGGTFAQSGTKLTVTPGTAAIPANGGSKTFAFTEAARPTLVSATGTAACDATTCADGCCTASGACSTTESATACGLGGKACAVCANSAPVCLKGVCEACAPGTTQCSANGVQTCGTNGQLDEIRDTSETGH